MKKALRWLLVLAWMGVIFAFSAQPHSGEVTRQYFGDFNVPIRKAAHMTEYAILFWLTRWATFGTTMRLALRAWLPFILTVGYACTDEYHQNFVPGRSATAGDVLVDSLGAACGWLIALLLQKAYGARASEESGS